MNEEDEVTFLLRLKPTPPVRRRYNIAQPPNYPPQRLPSQIDELNYYKNVSNTGWDVVIERGEAHSVPNRSSFEHFYAPSAPPQELDHTAWYCGLPAYTRHSTQHARTNNSGGVLLIQLNEVISARFASKMRELCKPAGGTVVAAVVAVLEKQASPHFHLQSSTSLPAKNINGRRANAADDKFESAVKDFDSIAEDVERIVNAANSLKRSPSAKLSTRIGGGLGGGRGEAAQPEDGALESGERRDAALQDDSDELGFSSSDDEDADESSATGSSSSSDEVVIQLPTIAEEDCNTPSSVLSLKGLNEDDDDEIDSSQTEDESTLKATRTAWTADGSTSSVSSSSSGGARRGDSRRCSDFQWLPPAAMRDEGRPPAGRPRARKCQERPAGSLDRRRALPRHERDQRARSGHAPPEGWCCAPPHDAAHFDGFHRRHEHRDAQRYGSSPSMLAEQQRMAGSHPDLYGRHEGCGGCCGYHMPPAAPCCYYGERGYRWTPPPPPTASYFKPNEQDEKFRKLQYEKDNLQLQVQVLTEQIEAQSDKITDLEKNFNEKKHLLHDTEEKLQREVLSRSSLETQKLELMSILSELKLQQAALERENYELRSHFNNNGDIKKPPILPRQTSTPIQSSQSMRISPSPSPVVNQENKPPKTPPANYKRSVDVHYGSLPRQQFISNGSSLSMVDSNANPATKKGVAFGRGISSLISGRARGYSVPNLAETEKVVIEDGKSDNLQTLNKSKGIKKIFGKIKRSNSGNLEDLPGAAEFQRGGVRATAAARLGWSEPQLTIRPDKPFAEWDTENICDWLQDLGLDQYIPEARRWIKNGTQLQEASIGEIEKELAIKNPLHRKKIQLAVIDTQVNGSSDPYLRQAGGLDTAWVLRWLDDAGLPQHKEAFLANRVDGRVLHRLTVDDLHLLRVGSQLHAASVRRGVQALRAHGFEPACLRRRALAEDAPAPAPHEVATWSTHRVMDWLRAVDLAEYAPNLRGAGVHGGLMVYETKFTVELLASLLAIPPEKTLLRRHLQTRFNELLGKEVIQEKREAESMMGYVPLTAASKLKVPKKSQFSLKRKKSKGEADYGDLVCPLNADKSGELNGSAHNMGMMKMASLGAEDAYHHVEQKLVRSLPASIANSPVPQRHV